MASMSALLSSAPAPVVVKGSYVTGAVPAAAAASSSTNDSLNAQAHQGVPPLPPPPLGYTPPLPPPPTFSGGTVLAETEISAENDEWTHMPPGWTTARYSTDGRIYYWEIETGRTSWTHPHATIPTPITSASNPASTRTAQNNIPTYTRNRQQEQQEWHNYEDTPMNATRRPDNRQCMACVALVAFFPFGLCAMFHSIKTDRAWSQRRYEDAVNHSRQADKFASFSICLGIAFWIWFLFFSKGDFDWDWPFD